MAGKTVDEATDRALDQLGVALTDAEVIVVSEPKTGLFGRMRVEARVRARVRPVGARPRRERSRRPARSGQGSRQEGSRQGNQRSATGSGGNRSGASANGSGRDRGSDRGGSERAGGATATRTGETRTGETRTGETGTGTGTSRSARRRRNRRNAVAGSASGVGGAETASLDVSVGERESSNGSMRDSASGRAPQRSMESKETADMAEGMTLEEQGEVGRAFLAGLLGELDMDGSVECRILDEETVEIAAVGEDLGMLVGPRGSTLSAVQDLTRAVVQRQCPSRTDRILVDVAGYRERRSAALKRFSVQIAEEVLASGQEKALEAMSPADRKSVHDAVNEMPGVVTRSEGEDPNRHIVIAPGD